MAESVVSPAWLSANRDRVTVLDVRDRWEYDGIGHVPGAVNVPFEEFRAEEHAAAGGDGSGMLPGADVFATRFGEAGITSTDHVVAYDDHHGVFAARVLITAALNGHPFDRLHLLDGDFSAWQRERATRTEPPSVDPVSYEVQPPTEAPLIDAESVAAVTPGEEAVIVDTRDTEEYEAGHIPGAIRLDWRELVDDQSRGLKATETIESILSDYGINRAKRVVLYCNTARRISHTYFVLRWLGYPDVAFYEGSLTEWKASGRPIES